MRMVSCCANGRREVLFFIPARGRAVISFYQQSQSGDSLKIDTVSLNQKCQVLHTTELLCNSAETGNVIYTPSVKEQRVSAVNETAYKGDQLPDCLHRYGKCSQLYMQVSEQTLFFLKVLKLGQNPLIF